MTTYKALAEKLGSSPRAVGRLCACNPDPETYPCYKVIHNDGRVGQYQMGQEEKVRRLEKDRVGIESGKIANTFIDHS